MFCPKCGSILVPKKESGKKILNCLSCGYSDKKVTSEMITENINGKKKLEVIDKSHEETDPETDVKCPKCGNKKATFWMVQTRAGDESETKFYRCTACKHTWRDYD